VGEVRGSFSCRLSRRPLACVVNVTFRRLFWVRNVPERSEAGLFVDGLTIRKTRLTAGVLCGTPARPGGEGVGKFLDGFIPFSHRPTVPSSSFTPLCPLQ